MLSVHSEKQSRFLCLSFCYPISLNMKRILMRFSLLLRELLLEFKGIFCYYQRDSGLKANEGAWVH